MKVVTLALVLTLTTGCASLRINPKNCKTNALWGSSPQTAWGAKKDELEQEKVLDLKMKETFLVFYNRDLRLRDLLEEHGIKCEEVKKVRVKISTTLFFMREVSLKVVKD